MPYKNIEKRKQYILDWKKENRRKRGLKKQGRKPYTEEQKIEAELKRKEYNKQWNKQNRNKNIQTYLWYAAKRRAKDKSLEFTISKEDIIIPEVCPYLKIELQLSNRTRGTCRDYWPTLDRIDNSKGYIKGNVEVISFKANTMKNNATKEELLLFAVEILCRPTF